MEQILQALHRAGYTTDGPDFAIGRPDRATLPLVTRAGAPVVAKQFPAGGGESTFANMHELWRARFRGRPPPPRLPPPNHPLARITVGFSARRPRARHRLDGNLVLVLGSAPRESTRLGRARSNCPDVLAAAPRNRDWSALALPRRGRTDANRPHLARVVAE